MFGTRKVLGGRINDESMAQFHEELNGLTASLDRALANAEPELPPRIIAKDGGFELQAHVLLTNGKRRWDKVVWGNSRAVCVRAAALRRWNVK